MKKIVKERDDIVFYIKMYPLRSHPSAYKKSKAIVCAKSLKLLDDAFAGKQLPEPSCETTEVDDNIKLAENLGITGTPAIVLQDGAIVPGYKDAETLVRIIEASVAAEEEIAEEGPGEAEEAAAAPEEEEAEETSPEPEKEEERAVPWY
jgi:thiol:disulfide interchange protein DsbC